MTPTNPDTKKRISLYFFCNCCFLLFMITAAFMIRSGQASYVPYTTVDKPFVRQVIASGETEAAWSALKTTEIARAEGFSGIVSMMDLMQIATLVMVLFFIVNCYVLFQLRGSATSDSVPVMIRS
jgi:hypothetical protein